jgi:hypothetical protein
LCDFLNHISAWSRVMPGVRAVGTQQRHVFWRVGQGQPEVASDQESAGMALAGAD